MKKRIMALLVGTTLTTGILAGCGGQWSIMSGYEASTDNVIRYISEHSDEFNKFYSQN